MIIHRFLVTFSTRILACVGKALHYFFPVTISLNFSIFQFFYPITNVIVYTNHPFTPLYSISFHSKQNFFKTLKFLSLHIDFLEIQAQICKHCSYLKVAMTSSLPNLQQNFLFLFDISIFYVFFPNIDLSRINLLNLVAIS